MSVDSEPMRRIVRVFLAAGVSIRLDPVKQVADLYNIINSLSKSSRNVRLRAVTGSHAKTTMLAQILAEYREFEPQARSAFTCRWSSNHCRRLSGSRTPRNDGRNRGASSAFLAATGLQSARSVAAHPANDASRTGTNAHFTTSFLLRIDYHIFSS